jgi:hypothetical protein
MVPHHGYKIQVDTVVVRSEENSWRSGSHQTSEKKFSCRERQQTALTGFQGFWRASMQPGERKPVPHVVGWCSWSMSRLLILALT